MNKRATSQQHPASQFNPSVDSNQISFPSPDVNHKPKMDRIQTSPRHFKSSAEVGGGFFNNLVRQKDDKAVRSSTSVDYKFNMTEDVTSEKMRTSHNLPAALKLEEENLSDSIDKKKKD